MSASINDLCINAPITVDLKEKRKTNKQKKKKKRKERNKAEW